MNKYINKCALCDLYLILGISLLCLCVSSLTPIWCIIHKRNSCILLVFKLDRPKQSRVADYALEVYYIFI